MLGMPPESQSLGVRLCQRRKFLGQSISDLSLKTAIPEKYIYALERNDYNVFPAKVYAVGFLKKLLIALSFENIEEILNEFGNEWEVHYYASQEIKPIPYRLVREPYLTPRRISIVAAVFLFVFFVGYIGLRFSVFLSAPELTLDEPQNFIALNEPLVRLKGKVEKESQLTVNGREIILDEHGNFDEMLELAGGVNSLEFVVKDRFGEESRVMRYVLVK